MLQGRSGLIYAATRDGKVHLLDQSLDEVAAWPVPGPVYTLAETADGEIWAGSKGMGITENTARPGTAAYVPRYYRREDDAYYAPNSDQIYDLNAADPARLWISSFDGSLSYIDLSDNNRQFISRKNRIPFPAQQLNGQGDDPLLRFGPRIGLHALLADGIDTGRRELTAEPVLHAVGPDPGTNESGQTVMLAHDLTDGPADERAGMDAAPGEQDIRHGRPPVACTPSGRNRRPADSGRGRYGRAR